MELKDNFELCYDRILKQNTLYVHSNEVIKIINYSEKSVALIGTDFNKEFNDGLKSLKGIWSKNTKLGACWFFKKTFLEKLKIYLNNSKF
jgi:hypothetical protein